MNKLLLDGIAQDRGDVLFNPCCYLKITKGFHFFGGNKQITGIQLSNVFIANIREDIGIKTSTDCGLIILRPFLLGREPRLGHCFECSGVITLCFELFGLCLFLYIRVNALSQKPSGLVTPLSCISK